ncbi:hypothetical protein C5Y96_07975 [Blastopirellula marina]|uniref:Uncharacterized protein n=2 Tax=Pirellulales TaxID=2691354 RepID=A0A2S8FY28_9BACT|nr:hypothetical protein C5Y96_07975 [Blastopirellula marina]RCS53801.1 hypothetical protein DTL36_07985 [Bremerella cremea]
MAVWVAAFWLATPTHAQADRLILRDLRLLNNITVIGFDEEGVKVTDNNLVPWHEIELGTVSPDKQADFDRLRKELGDPLFRIHQRLKVGDYAGASEPAEAIFDRYKDRDSKVAYMVCQAAMWGRLAEGEREAALEPYFCCLRIMKKSARTSEVTQLPGSRTLDYDKQTGLTSDMLPIFFDHEKAAAALTKAGTAATSIGSAAPDGVLVYMAALSIAAEDFAQAETWQSRIRSGNPTLKQWPALLNAQLRIQSGDLIGARADLEPLIYSFETWNQPVAWYLLGTSGSRSSEFLRIENGVLDLLHIPALYGSEYPELAAAALSETYSALNRIQQPTQAKEIRRQLLLFYGGTTHAQQIRAATQSKSNP